MPPFLASAPNCAADNARIGFTIQYRCFGEEEMVVAREQFERQAMTYGPGSLGCIKPGTPVDSPRFTWKEMSYMPGDTNGGMPTWVEFEWVTMTSRFKEWSALQGRKSAAEQYSPSAIAESKRRWAELPHHSQRIDLATVVTPELMARVRANRQNTQLKITFTFEGDQVHANAEALKWR